MLLFNYVGDPLTRGWAATENAHRLDPAVADNLSHAVPTTPYGQVEPLRRQMGGPEVPDGWQDGLPFTYHVGTGPAKVHLKLAIEYQVNPDAGAIQWKIGVEWQSAHRDIDGLSTPTRR